MRNVFRVHGRRQGWKGEHEGKKVEKGGQEGIIETQAGSEMAWEGKRLGNGKEDRSSFLKGELLVTKENMKVKLPLKHMTNRKESVTKTGLK